jgi:hypothetical protein
VGSGARGGMAGYVLAHTETQAEILRMPKSACCIKRIFFHLKNKYVFK